MFRPTQLSADKENSNVDRLKGTCFIKTSLLRVINLQYFFNTQLELARLEDALKYPAYANKSMVQMEETSEFVTGKVQSTILKKEAALAVRSTYKHILSILKKVQMRAFPICFQMLRLLRPILGFSLC